MLWIIVVGAVIIVILLVRIAIKEFSRFGSPKNTATPKPLTTTPAPNPSSDYGSKLPVSENFKKGSNKPKQSSDQSPTKKPSTTEKDPIFEEMMG